MSKQSRRIKREAATSVTDADDVLIEVDAEIDSAHGVLVERSGKLSRVITIKLVNGEMTREASPWQPAHRFYPDVSMAYREWAQYITSACGRPEVG